MTDFSLPSIAPRRAGLSNSSAASLSRWLRQALIRWWDRQCQLAERKTRFVPYY